jgi:hypothetical protein
LNDESPVSLEAWADEGIGLRVAFAWSDGRWEHIVGAFQDGELLWVLRSVEGNAEQDFPPSPPLQQLHRTDLPDGRVALLLVGMAGRSHWSMSCEVEPGRARILFDVACRAVPACRATLGTAYQISTVVPTVDDSQITWRQGEGHRATMRGLPSTPDASPCSFCIVDRCLTIRPAASEQIPIRWRYELVLERA